MIVLDYALRLGRYQWKRRGNGVLNNKKVITDFEFADDIRGDGSGTEADNTSGNIMCQVQFKDNPGKTKCISFSQLGNTNIVAREDDVLEKVDDDMHLGSWVCTTDKDIKTRKDTAWRAFNQLKLMWKSTLSRQIKQRLFITTVEYVLLCGCENWTMTNKQ